ncbi:putative quinol monooxygenase [Burkholderia gladioli]|uniref:putative quinol monooxygenase n=1 Tax=Burkholderia gladioli TaxID=28095 RepID=UPI00039BC494|nr:putative quinol monooxygenase [Burkholderia gladioli]NHH83245.1 putative monooxygenase [Burkholderia gladioli]
MMAAPAAITVVARWQALPGRTADVLVLAAALPRQSLAEPGCLGYEVFRGVDDPATILLLERYRDPVAVEAHRASPHYRELLVERILPLLAQRQVELLRA